MWVVKLGGSLHRHPMLPAWLRLLGELGGGRVIVVCGGGVFADEVRKAQAHWQFDDLSAHNMAILAMAQTAYLAHALAPSLQLARTLPDIRRVLHRGQAALWLPFELQRHRPSRWTDWDTSSDSIALELAKRLNVERLVLVKSCPVDQAPGLAALGMAGVIDRQFAELARDAVFPIDLLHCHELGRVRGWLLGEPRFTAA